LRSAYARFSPCAITRPARGWFAESAGAVPSHAVETRAGAPRVPFTVLPRTAGRGVSRERPRGAADAGAGRRQPRGRRQAHRGRGPRGAARPFVEEVAFGPGAWENQLPPEAKRAWCRTPPRSSTRFRTPINSASMRTPSRISRSRCVSQADPRPRRCSRGVIDRLVELVPSGARETIEGAAHVPQVTTPDTYVQVTTRAVSRSSARSSLLGRWRLRRSLAVALVPWEPREQTRSSFGGCGSR
jgi:hypothetical protein